MASTCQEIRPLEFSLWNTTLNKQVHSSVSFLVLLILQSTEKSKNEGKCKLQPSLKAEQGGPAWVPINIFNLLIFTISKGEHLPNKLRKLWEILITFWKRWSRLATFFFFFPCLNLGQERVNDILPKKKKSQPISNIKKTVRYTKEEDRGWNGWMSSPTQWTSLHKLQEIVKDREAWRVLQHGVAKSQARLSEQQQIQKARL